MPQRAITNQENAYAHHIQRFMVTGNSRCSRASRPPRSRNGTDRLCRRLRVGGTANTNGMASSRTAVISRRSPTLHPAPTSTACPTIAAVAATRCGREETGPGAGPFNYLYWNFLARHQRKLDGSPRMAQMYRTYEKFDDAERQRIKSSAETFLATLKPAKSWG